LEKMRLAKATIAAAETGNDWAESGRRAQCRHDSALATAFDRDGRKHVRCQREIVDMPVDRLVLPKMPAKPRPNPAGAISASRIYIPAGTKI
jgi:hypothetical protein